MQPHSAKRPWKRGDVRGAVGGGEGVEKGYDLEMTRSPRIRVTSTPRPELVFPAPDPPGQAAGGHAPRSTVTVAQSESF